MPSHVSRIPLFRPLVLLLSVGIAANCAPPVESPTHPPPTPGQTPAAATRLPTPVPTIPTPSVVPGTQDPLGASAGLVIRMITCSDACGPVAGVTILDDGRIIWQDQEGGRVQEAQLTPAGLATVRERIAQIDALRFGGNYGAELRPGKEPLPRGTTSTRFEVQGDGRIVVVTTGDPADFAAERDLWIIPPEMTALAAFAAQLNNPAAWLGANALAVVAHPYAPARYVVTVDLVAGVGTSGEFAVDVDNVKWPFGKPIESIGAPVGKGEGGPPPRCLVLDSTTAAATASAESARGAKRDLRQWMSSLEYGWRRANGFVQVTLRQLLPHQAGSCAELVPAAG